MLPRSPQKITKKNPHWMICFERIAPETDNSKKTHGAWKTGNVLSCLGLAFYFFRGQFIFAGFPESLKHGSQAEPCF